MPEKWTVERCLREDPKLSLTDLEHLKEWHKKQPHLPPVTDLEFITCLYGNYYSLEKSKLCIDRYFTIRTQSPDVFTNRDILLPENAAQEKYIMVAELPKRDSHGYRVIGTGLQPIKDVSELIPARTTLLGYSLVNHLVNEWPICPGYVIVLDASNLHAGHISKMAIPLIMRMITLVQEACPLRLKIVHVINLNPLVEKVMMITKPFLGEALQNLLHFHSDKMDSFYEALPRDILPKEFGGTCGSVLDYYHDLLNRLKETREELIAEEKRVVNEALRPGQAKDADKVFGMEGSFKKLDLD